MLLHKVLRQTERQTEISASWYGPYYIWGRPKKLSLQLIPVNPKWSVSYKLEEKLRPDSLMKNPEDEEPLPVDEVTYDTLSEDNTGDNHDCFKSVRK